MDNNTIVTVALGLSVCAGWLGVGAWIGSRMCRHAGSDKAWLSVREVKGPNGEVSLYPVPKSTYVGEVHL